MSGLVDGEYIELNGHTIEGHHWGDIIFQKEGKFRCVKDTLPKKDLILRLGVPSEKINTKFKDKILDIASKKGRKSYIKKEGKETLSAWEAVELRDA